MARLYRLLLSLASLVVSAHGAAKRTLSPTFGCPDQNFNGGFESGLNQWTTGGNTNWESFGVPYSGYHHVSTTGDTLSATFDQLTPGTIYVITFHWRAINGGGSVDVSLAGTNRFHVDSEQAHDWQLHTFTYTATSSSALFSITLTGDEYHLDDINYSTFPVLCSPDFPPFDPETGLEVADDSKVYPSPPNVDPADFPSINANGDIEFTIHSVSVSSTYQRIIRLGLTPADVPPPAYSDYVCEISFVPSPGCPANEDMSLTFGHDALVPYDLNDLVTIGCLKLEISPDKTTATYSASALISYQDAYTMGSWYNELQPFKIGITVPYVSSDSTSATVDVVSDQVTIEYQPVQVINTGSGNPTLVFTTVARTLYPFVAYSSGDKYTAPAGSATTLPLDTTGDDVCTLYQSSGVVADSTTYCDQNAGACTVECIHSVSFTPSGSNCDLSGYVWEYDFQEYQDYSTSQRATQAVTDPAWTSFSKHLTFDTSPVWDVCPSASASDYSTFIHAKAVHGHYDTTSGDAVPDSTSPATINTPLNFGFEIYIDQLTAPSALKIYQATLTEVKVARPDGREYYLVGSSSDVISSIPGGDTTSVHDLTFAPTYASGKYPMTPSPQVAYDDPKFASVEVSFTPNVGTNDPGNHNMLYYSDSSTYPSGVTLTVTFSGIISLFADGSTPAKRSIHNLLFTRQLQVTPNTTYADPNQVVRGFGNGNSTTIVIQVPDLVKAVNAATIAGSVVGGVVGLLLVGVAIWFYRRSKKVVVTQLDISDKLETASA